MRILGAQWRPKTGGTAANLKRMLDVVAKRKPDLALFPEMWLTGYSVRDRVIELAEPADGPSVEAVSKAARKHKSTVVFGFPERARAQRGAIYNSAAVCTPDGEVGVYRKWFLPNFGPYEEKMHFHKGTVVPVFETPFGRLGVQLCYDLWLVFAGGSSLVGPRGEAIEEFPLVKEALFECEVDLEDTDRARPFRPTLRDSRAEVFDEAAGLHRGRNGGTHESIPLP